MTKSLKGKTKRNNKMFKIVNFMMVWTFQSFNPQFYLKLNPYEGETSRWLFPLHNPPHLFKVQSLTQI